MPNVSAATTATSVRVPVPRSCVPTADDDAAVRGDFTRAPRRAAAAAAPRVDRHAHAGLDRAGRRVAGRMPLVPAELRGALRRYAAHIALGASGGRFLIRNSTGSIFTRSASSSISTSVMKEPCGWPGARIGRCWPVLMKTSLCVRRRFGNW